MSSSGNAEYENCRPATSVSLPKTSNLMAVMSVLITILTTMQSGSGLEASIIVDNADSDEVNGLVVPLDDYQFCLSYELLNLRYNIQ